MNDTISQEVVLSDTFAAIAERYLNPTKVWGYSWGFSKLDELTGGIHHGDVNELTLVGARSGGGKSSFGISVALSVAIQFKKEWPMKDVRIILLEMEPIVCMRRIISQLSGVSLTAIKTGFMSELEYARVEKTKRVLSGLPIRWVRGKKTAGDISRIVRAMIDDYECGYWLVDHIGIIDTPDGNEAYLLGQISKELLALARSTAPGMILGQLNRGGFGRKDPTPTAADLRGSDRPYHDADNVFFLHRPDTYLPKGEERRTDVEVGYVILDKQRDGVSGIKTPLVYVTPTAQWSDMTDESLAAIEQDSA